MTIRGLLHRLRVLTAPRSYAREVEAEIRFHLELDAMHARGDGMTETAAEYAARHRFGNVTHVREEVRRMSGIELMDRIRQDVGYAVRGLRRSPGFTLAVVLTLGLGLGVNAAMFAFLDSVFVKPPASVASPGEVRRLYIDHSRPKEPGGRLAFGTFRYPHIREIGRSVALPLQLGVFTSGKDSVSFTTGSRIVPARRTLANTAYFQVLGIRPALGRFFEGQEDRIESPVAVAVISHDLWVRVFNRDPHVLGSTIRIKNRPITVIGVAAERFAGIELDRSDFWMPISNYLLDASGSPPWYETFHNNFQVITRLPNSEAELRFTDIATRAYRTVRIARFEYDSTALIRTGPILSALGPGRKDQEFSISLRLGGVALIVLLIAAANVSNLLLVRATRRGREIAVRRALGVTRARLFEQLFTESLLLALIGGAVSIVLAVWAGTALRRLLLPSVSWSTGMLDVRSALFAALATLVVGLLVGLAPAVHAWRPDVISSLKAGSRNAAYRRSRLRSGLLITQIALSVVLLVGAGVFVRSLRNVQAIDLGYDLERTMIVTTVGETSGHNAALELAMPAIVNRLSAIDGVETVATASAGPMMGESFQPMFHPTRDTLPEVGGMRGAAFIHVSPSYFRAAGVRIIAGRVFSESERSGIVVGELMARAYWPGEPAVGKCVILTAKDRPCIPVIGVVEDVHSFGIIEDQGARYYLGNSERPHGTIIIRAAADRHEAISKLVSDEVRRLVPTAEAVRIRTIPRILERQFRPWRLGATLFTAMGVLALIVAAIGVYSVIAYAVTQRTNEMGIRVAMGAQVRDIARLVIGDGIRTVAIGVGLGIVMTVALGRLVASLLFGVSVRDPWVIAFAAVVLVLIGLAASLIPAMRAARVNPVNALRAE